MDKKSRLGTDPLECLRDTASLGKRIECGLNEIIVS